MTVSHRQSADAADPEQDAGHPGPELAVLPGTTHVGLLNRAKWLVAMVTPFLDAPLPQSGRSARA